MVDENEVYLDIKINYKNTTKNINSTELLSIDEIKTKIINLFSLNKCTIQDLDLFLSKNNELIKKEEDIFFLSDEINEYHYAIELNVKNKSDKKMEEIEEIKKLKKVNNELDKKKKNLKNQIYKVRFDIECNKKIYELRKEVGKKKKEIKLKKIEKMKNKIANEISKIIINSIKQWYINEIKKKLNKEIYKNNIDKNIKNKNTTLQEDIKKLDDSKKSVENLAKEI